MELYTERHGMRKAMEKTYTVSIEAYTLLFNCCKKYYNNLAWKYPKYCPDGEGCCGIDMEAFDLDLKYEIPNLFRDVYGSINIPTQHKDCFDFNSIAKAKKDRYDQYALIDYIEFFAENIRDITEGEFHRYIESSIGAIKEKGTAQLLQEAIALHKSPYPNAPRDAVEKIWDGFERLKSYYTDLDKKHSANKIVEDISNHQSDLKTLFEAEFRALTEIGNKYRIRHHETNKIEITDVRYYDYFFNRCLSLIALAIQYLE